MRNYENFDNSFFIKIICIISAISLLFVIVISVVGIFSGDTVHTDNNSEADTFIFDTPSSDTTIDTDTADTTPFTFPQMTETLAPETESIIDTKETSAPETSPPPTTLIEETI